MNSNKKNINASKNMGFPRNEKFSKRYYEAQAAFIKNIQNEWVQYKLDGRSSEWIMNKLENDHFKMRQTLYPYLQVKKLKKIVEKIQKQNNK